MQIRRLTLNTIKGNPRYQKAVAMAICIKNATGRSSIVLNYNPNKIQQLTKISPNTFKKYLPIMIELDLVKFVGKDNQHLVIRRMHSKQEKRNIDIHRFCFKSFTEIYRSLRAFLVLLVQHRKDYIQRILQIAQHPRKGQDCKAARKTVRNLVRKGVLRSPQDEYKELGISYDHFAKETGNCARTCQRIVAYALKKRWWRKKHHFEWIYMPGVNYRYVDGCTFTLANYGCVVRANTYTLSRGICGSLGGGTK